MAIAPDAFSDGSNTTGTSLSWNHTVTGTNTILWVFTVGSTGGSDKITDVQWNTNEAFTKACTLQNPTRWTALWCLINPTTGTHSIKVNASGSDFIGAVAESYTGVGQSGQPDNTTTNGVASATNLTGTLTTVADNCWTVMGFVSNSGAGNVTAGAGTTLRGAGGGGTTTGFLDSNGVIHPAGSSSLVGNDTSGANGLTLCMASMSPPGAVTALATKKLLLGVGI